MLHVVPAQEGEAAQDGGVAAVAGRVGAARVVDGGGAVDAHAQQEAVLGEEFGQAGGKQGAVGLDAVGDLRAGAGVAALQAQERAVEVLAHQQRLAALEGEGVRGEGQGQKAADQAGEGGLVHAVDAGLRVKLGAPQVEAIGAPEVAVRAGGFDEQRKGTHGWWLRRGTRRNP